MLFGIKGWNRLSLNTSVPMWYFLMLQFWDDYAATNTKQTKRLIASKKSSRGEVRRDISSISDGGVEKRRNMKLKIFTEKINKQKNCNEQVMTDGHTLSPSLHKHYADCDVEPSYLCCCPEIYKHMNTVCWIHFRLL